MILIHNILSAKNEFMMFSVENIIMIGSYEDSFCNQLERENLHNTIHIALQTRYYDNNGELGTFHIRLNL